MPALACLLLKKISLSDPAASGILAVHKARVLSELNPHSPFVKTLSFPVFAWN